MLDLLKLKTFRRAALTSNFTRTAAELGYSQSSVTAQIKSLEKELGTRLFDRCANGLVLTAVGRRTLEYAGRLLDLAEETRAALSVVDEPGGTLTIGAPDFVLAYRLPPLLQQFQEAQPRTQIQMRSASNQRTLAYDLAEGTVDVAFIVGDDFQTKRLIAEPLAEESLIFAASPRYRCPSSSKSEDLAGAQILTTSSPCPFRDALDRMLESNHIRLSSRLELGGMEAVKRCGLKGLGIAALPEIAIAEELANGELIHMCRQRSGLHLTTYAVRHGERSVSPAIAAFWEILAHAPVA